MDNNNFEQYPGEKLNNEPSEADLARATKWQSAMGSEDVPEFTGDTAVNEEMNGQGEDLSNAAAIVNYGLNAAAKEYGVEVVVQKIKDFDPSNSVNPIGDLFASLGVDAPAGTENLKLEGAAAKPEEIDFYNSDNAPATINRSTEGAFQAINDMKELISKVEGADPRYEELRQGAKTAGKGYFEYAVGSSVDKGLTDLFRALSAEPEAEEPQNPEDTPGETPETMI